MFRRFFSYFKKPCVFTRSGPAVCAVLLPALTDLHTFSLPLVQALCQLARCLWRWFMATVSRLGDPLLLCWPSGIAFWLLAVFFLKNAYLWGHKALPLMRTQSSAQSR